MLLKKYKEDFAEPIAHIINQSFRECVFPSSCKTAIVTPIFKSGNRKDIKNYRPISILPAVSKVIEKIVAEQLIEHLDNGNMLHPMQFRFRPKHSTDTACCYFLEVIKSSLEKGRVVGAVFLDLRKAFDTINHSVLLTKLWNFNLTANTSSWLQSYLADRYQCVRINDKTSSFRSCTTGVPQGSILGPLLFSL